MSKLDLNKVLKALPVLLFMIFNFSLNAQKSSPCTDCDGITAIPNVKIDCDDIRGSLAGYDNIEGIIKCLECRCEKNRGKENRQREIDALYDQKNAFDNKAQKAWDEGHRASNKLTDSNTNFEADKQKAINRLQEFINYKREAVNTQKEINQRFGGNANTKFAEDDILSAQKTISRLQSKVKKSTLAMSGKTESNQFSSGPLEYNRQGTGQNLAYEKKMEDRRMQISQMQQELAQQRVQSQNLQNAADQTMAQWTQQIQNGGTNYIDGVQPLAEEFARQGNMEGAIGSVVVGTAASIIADLSQRKKEQEAQERAEAERQRRLKLQREREQRYKEEQERLKRKAFELIVNQRKAIVEAFSESMPIPLSSTQLETDKVYYFLYATDPNTINKPNTTIYVSNVFEIAQYKNGTWPYQRKVDREIVGLTPTPPTMQGYYLSLDDARAMRKELVNSFKSINGVSLKEIRYKGKPKSVSESNRSPNSLGIPLSQLKNNGGNPGSNPKSKTTEGKPNSEAESNKDSHPLGIPLEQLKKNGGKSTNKPKAKSTGGLGIPIKDNLKK